MPAACEASRPHALVVLVIAILIGLAACAALSTVSAAARMDRALGEATWSERVVRRGETVWDIARETGVDADPQMVVSEILKRSGRERAAVEPGDTLMVPSA